MKLPNNQKLCPKEMAQKEGSTLIEVIVASFLLLLVIGSSITALGQAIYITEKSRDTGMASAWIRSEMEHLRSLNWAAIEALEDGSIFNQSPPDNDDPAASKFTSNRDITDREGGLRVFKLEATWKDSKKRDHALSSITFISQNGISAEGS